jgi:hypothetical protein
MALLDWDSKAALSPEQIKAISELANLVALQQSKLPVSDPLVAVSDTLHEQPVRLAHFTFWSSKRAVNRSRTRSSCRIGVVPLAGTRFLILLIGSHILQTVLARSPDSAPEAQPSRYSALAAAVCVDFRFITVAGCSARTRVTTAKSSTTQTRSTNSSLTSTG